MRERDQMMFLSGAISGVAMFSLLMVILAHCAVPS